LPRDLPIPLDVERPDRLAHVRDDSHHGLDLRSLSRVLAEHRRDRAGVLPLAGGPVGGVLRLPALLRAGAAGGLGEVMQQVAVVGSGLAGFTVYQTLRRAFAPGEIAVFGTDADPAAAWRVQGAAIRQSEMRSESDGHCLPTSFPGLAFSSTRGRRSVRPLLESVLDRYHPTVDEFLSHVERL